MEDSTKMIEALFEKLAEYGKTSYALWRLKILGKVSDLISLFISNALVFVLVASFMLFVNLGFAFWIGEILGKTYYGFFAVAVFYGILAIVSRFVLRNWMTNLLNNYFIKKALK